MSLLDKAKPILFNTEMVKAILDDRKTQTRRVAGDKILNRIYKYDCYIEDGKIFESCMCQGMPDGSGGLEVDRWEEDVTTTYSKYKVGDILYVREKSYFVDCDCQSPWQCSPQGWYATDEVSYSGIRCSVETIPSIHMRKEHARIFLKVINVRVERVKDISDKDCIKEGISEVGFYPDEGFPLCSGYMIGKDDGKTALSNTPQKPFSELWNSTAKDGYKWEDNPYVFVYEFERVEE